MSVSSGAAFGAGAAWQVAHAELKIGLRTQAFRGLAILAFIMGVSVGGMPGRGAAYSAYAAAQTSWQVLGLLATIWMALAAVRETSLRTASLVYSKPQPTERLVLASFIGGIVPMFGLLAALFLGAVVARVFTGQGLAGSSVYVTQFFRAAAPILFAGGAAFCLALLFQNALAGSIAGLIWMVLIAGRAYLPKALFPAYSQNAVFFALIGIGLVLLAARFYRRKRRGWQPPPAWLGLSAAAFVILPAYGLYHVAINSHDPMIRMDPMRVRMAGQHAKNGMRIPGFTLPDKDGRLVGLSHFPDRIIVLAIVNPDEAESAMALTLLEEAQRKFGAQGVQCVAVCTSQDNGAAATLARGMALSYPIVQDLGTYNGPSGLEHAPVAEAYEALIPPKVIVTDRRRRLRGILTDRFAYEGTELEQTIRERLESEPLL